MSRSYARSPKGERAYGYRPYQKGKNTTIISTLGFDGIVATMVIDGYMDGDAFLAYVQQVLVPALSSGKVVVMDNLSSHKVSGVSEAIKNAGADILCLPPYSPELSPIENCWSKIKSILRKVAARDEDSLQEAIENSLNSVTSNDALGWFKNCGYCIALN